MPAADSPHKAKASNVENGDTKKIEMAVDGRIAKRIEIGLAAFAATAMLACVGTVIANRVDNARQDERILYLHTRLDQILSEQRDGFREVKDSIREIRTGR